MKRWLAGLCLLEAGCRLFFLPDPSAIVTRPSRYGEVLAEGEDVFLAFDFPVDRYSAEKAVSVEAAAGPVAGRFRWEGQRMSFLPDAPLTPGARYLLQGRGEVYDLSGRPYPLDLEIPFFYLTDAASPPLVLRFSPAHGSVVSAGQPIEIHFSNPMDPASFADGFSLSPGTAHRLQWAAEQTQLSVLPEEAWEELCSYRVRLEAGLRDREGVPLARTVEISFRVQSDTTSPTVTGAAPALNDWSALFPLTGKPLTEIGTRDAIRITFSEPMDEQATSAAFSLSPQVPGTLAWIGGDLVFVPASDYDMDTAYLLSIDQEARDASGNPLLQEELFDFTTAAACPLLRVLEIRAVKDSTLVLVPPFTTASAVDLDPCTAEEPYEFLAVFSLSFPSAEDRYQAQNLIALRSLEAGTGPYPLGYTWLAGERTLSVSFTNLSAAAGSEAYYLLEIPAGSDGVRSGGSFLREEVRQLFRVLP